MKTVVLQRAWADERATLGMLSIMGEPHDPIFTLENPLRTTVIDNRIPAGQYICAPYSGTIHKDVYIIQNIPGRTAILIHPGNTEKDTEGCVLVGLSASCENNEPVIEGSRKAMEYFREIIGNESFNLIVVERQND